MKWNLEYYEFSIHSKPVNPRLTGFIEILSEWLRINSKELVRKCIYCRFWEIFVLRCTGCFTRSEIKNIIFSVRTCTINKPLSVSIWHWPILISWNFIRIYAEVQELCYLKVLMKIIKHPVSWTNIVRTVFKYRFRLTIMFCIYPENFYTMYIMVDSSWFMNRWKNLKFCSTSKEIWISMTSISNKIK